MMDISKDPLALILIIFVFATTFYLLSPRLFRFFCIGIGLSWWQSEPVASVKTTIETCASVYRGSSQWVWTCKSSARLLGCQVFVYAVAVMCVLKEIEYIVGRKEGRRTK